MSSSSDSTVEDFDSNLSRSVEDTKKKYSKQSLSHWDAEYTKYFVCKFCGNCYKLKDALHTHVKTHNNLLMQYNQIFEKHCSVDLIKTDDNPNITCSLKNVVLDQSKIIHDEGDVRYYVAYLSGEITDKITKIGTCETVMTVKSAHAENSNDNVFVKKVKKKKVLQMSRSSNDTVVLDLKKKVLPDSRNECLEDVDKEAVSNDSDCINIDDDDDDDFSVSAPFKTNVGSKGDTNSKNSAKAQVSDYKTIQSIISMCHSKYLKKMGCFENVAKPIFNKESHLKHKLLSMGLKVINKQGFASTGLLRYMESRNLDINWINTTGMSSTNTNNKETNYVHIIPKLKAKEQSVSDNTGWKMLPVHNSEPSANNQNDLHNDAIPSHQIHVNPVSSITSDSELLRNFEDQKYCMVKASQAILYPNTEGILDTDMKLLNASPVANPKQLPKKSNTMDCKSNVKAKREKVVSKSIKETVQNNDTISFDLNDDLMNSEICMPIITSTTSLAVPVSVDKNDGTCENVTTNNNNVVSNNIIHESEKAAPRIKVKPFSELMPKKALTNLNQCQVNAPSIWNINEIGDTPQNTTENHAILVNRTEALTATKQVPNVLASSMTAQSKPSDEYVILDTVEFPNTKTNSPFKYLKDLLHMHNIILLHSNEFLLNNFTCLIKFKLHLSQESIVPIVLWLSLYCAENKFFLEVKDLYQVNINLDGLTPNWQWQILKVYTSREDVINKVYQNAKTVGQQVYEYTKRFLCLLKSVKNKLDV